jgi:hypothetical protein
VNRRMSHFLALSEWPMCSDAAAAAVFVINSSGSGN